MTDTWSPSVYLQFEDERTRPARDLLAQVPLTIARQIVDVGCGPANSTALLASRFPGAEIVGLDSSPAMLEQARNILPSARFLEADAHTWLPDTAVDLVFANAIYQWIPAHLELLPRIVKSLAPGAVLAVQMPDNVEEPTHRLMRTAAEDPRWARRLKDAAREPLPPPRSYYNALRPVSSRVEIWHTIYNHALAGADAIVDWVRGTGLRPFVDPLQADERAEFLSRYRELLADAYPAGDDGRVLLRFPRLFMVAVRR
jgi:trans-aconitate 2-methyltransferase